VFVSSFVTSRMVLQFQFQNLDSKISDYKGIFRNSFYKKAARFLKTYNAKKEV
jgi:hypothetical protein